MAQVGVEQITLVQDSGLPCLRVALPERTAQPDEPCASLIIAGDLCWTPRPGVPDPSELDACPWASLVPLLADQDLSIANLEAALTSRDHPIVKAGPRVRSSPSLAALVRGGGFGAVGLANNHVGDFGEQGVLDTLAACHAAGLGTAGAGRDAVSAPAPLCLDLGCVPCAVVAVTEGCAGAAGAGRAGVAQVAHGRSHAVVAGLRETHAVIVLLHAGAEYYPLPSPGLLELARSFADAGAAAVVVHHQHVPGGVEYWKSTPIVYGTGNFLFPMYYPYRFPEWHEGYLVRLRLSAERVVALDLFPYHQSRGARTVDAMTAADAGELAGRVRERSGRIADADRIAASWRRYSANERARFLDALLGLTRVERRLVRLTGLWPWWRVRRDRVAALGTVLRTESYREAAQTIIDEELRRSGMRSRGV